MSAQEVETPQDESVRERLLVSASRLFAQKGYSATTVREIVDAVGVTKPVLYYYFGNKEGIYLALMGEALFHVHELAAQAVEADGSARQRLERLFDRTFALILEHLDVVRVMDSIYYGPPQGAPFFDFEVFHREFEGVVRSLVEAGIQSGELRSADVEAVSYALIGALEIAKGIHLCHPERCRGREGLQQILDVVFHGVLAPTSFDKETRS